MGFDGVETFAGKKTGVQAWLKDHAPHSISVHFSWHVFKLQIAPMASNMSTLHLPLFGNIFITHPRDV